MSEAKNRGGRPKVSSIHKRKITVSTRLSEIEYGLLMKKTEQAELSVYEYLKRAVNSAVITHHDYQTMKANIDRLTDSGILRMIVLKSEVRTAMNADAMHAVNRMTDSMNRLRTELRNIGINLNAVAKKANVGFARDYSSDMKKFSEEISFLCRQCIVGNERK